MIEEITEKHRQRCERLAEERYEALRNTIAHLYGQAFLDELEMNVDERAKKIRFFDGVQARLGILRKQYRTKCKISNPYNPIGKAAYHAFYEHHYKMHKHFRTLSDLRKMMKRSKVRKRYNRLAEVIRRDLGEEVQKELIWKAKTLALADITQKCKSCKSSAIKGYAENDLSFALRHLRIMYAYTREQHENRFGTRIHNQINANYRRGMLDYYKNE